MTLKGQLSEDEFGKLNDVLKQEYRKGEDGHYYPDVAEANGWAFENVASLRATMRSERERREEWERRHTELAKTLNGVDQAEVAKLADYKRQIEEMKKWTPDDKVQARIAALEGEYKLKLAEAQRAAETIKHELGGQVSELLIDTEARRVLEKLKCIDPDMLLPHVQRETRVEQKDGTRPTISVVDDHGDPRPTKKAGAVGNMQLEELLEGYVKRWPAAFKGSGATGGGVPGARAGGSGGNSNGHPSGDAFSKLTPEQRLYELRRQGQPT